MLTLELAVMLPAAALIYLNFYQLKSIKRDKVLEAAIHGDFHQMLAISEKQINQKAYKLTEGIRERSSRLRTLTAVGQGETSSMRSCQSVPWLAHVYPLRRGPRVPVSFAAAANERSVFLSRSTSASRRCSAGGSPLKPRDAGSRLHKRTGRITWYPRALEKRADGYAYQDERPFLVAAAVSKDRVVIRRASFDPDYLKQNFFPKMLDELIAYKLGEDGGNPLAMVVYPARLRRRCGLDL